MAPVMVRAYYDRDISRDYEQLWRRWLFKEAYGMPYRDFHIDADTIGRLSDRLIVKARESRFVQIETSYRVYLYAVESYQERADEEAVNTYAWYKRSRCICNNPETVLSSIKTHRGLDDMPYFVALLEYWPEPSQSVIIHMCYADSPKPNTDQIVLRVQVDTKLKTVLWQAMNVLGCLPIEMGFDNMRLDNEHVRLFSVDSKALGADDRRWWMHPHKRLDCDDHSTCILVTLATPCVDRETNTHYYVLRIDRRRAFASSPILICCIS